MEEKEKVIQNEQLKILSDTIIISKDYWDNFNKIIKREFNLSGLLKKDNS